MQAAQHRTRCRRTVAGLSAPERARSARVLVQIFQAMTPVVVAAASEEEEREAEVRELKKVLRRYLAPLDG